jgi:N-glycosylase/DNA lyase
VVSAPDDARTLEPLLRDYLGLDTDLEAVYEGISTDEHIGAAVARYRGLRVLRQDPWECLVSFICSSASNIPRITRNVESICSAYGRPIWLGDYLRNSFPTPRELAEAGEAALRELGLGYRAEYIAATTDAIAAGRPDLMTLREASYGEALDALTALPGVGDKVANCVLLFSLDKPEAFPVDTHIRGTLREMYPESQSAGSSARKMREWAQEHFGPYAGYANQYLFHNRRLAGRG